MSGGKFALPVLAASLLVELMIAQQVAGMAAGQMRGEAEEEERQQRIEETRIRFMAELQEVQQQIQLPNALHPTHKARLMQQCIELMTAVHQAQNEKELWKAAQASPYLIADLNTACMNKRFHDSQETRIEQNQLQARLKELEHGLAQIGTAEFAALDPAGHEAAHRAVAAASAAVTEGAKDTETLLATAAEAITLHGRRGAERKVERMAQHAEFEQALTELHALVAGLKRDPMVTRWQNAELAALEALVQETPLSEKTTTVLALARDQAAAMIKAAGEAQFKADTRDYITNSIACSLTDMGFVVSEPMDEVQDHPATAKVLQAASASGKAVFVSVPVEGQVWYEVDGYTKTTEAGLSGDITLACDEGERMLTEMHARLEEAFQVEMSEIWWEGKDPNRLLRRADSLPVSAGAARGSTR